MDTLIIKLQIYVIITLFLTPGFLLLYSASYDYLVKCLPNIFPKFFKPRDKQTLVQIILFKTVAFLSKDLTLYIIFIYLESTQTLCLLSSLRSFLAVLSVKDGRILYSGPAIYRGWFSLFTVQTTEQPGRFSNPNE